MRRSFSLNNLFYILVTSVVIGFIYNQLSPNGIGLIREEVVLSSYNGTDTETTEPDYTKIKAIKIDDAFKFFNEGITFVDSRDMWEFADGHIKGAINFPEIEFEPDHPALNKFDKNEKLVIYCSSTECGLSTKLAIELQKLGYRQLFVFEEGWDLWLEKGYPTETSELK